MRVLHIATFRSGGAGAAAFRLHRAMVDAGMESKFLSFEQRADPTLQWYSFSGNDNSIGWKTINRFIQLKHKIGRLFSGSKQEIRLVNYCGKLRSSVPAEYVSVPFSDIRIDKHPLYKWADVVHLHWVATVLDYPSFFKYNKKPVVWTFHDLNPVLGFFHYPGDEQKFATESEHANNETGKLKRHAMATASFPLVIVAPSVYFKQYITDTGFPSERVFVISYVTPLNVFRPYPKGELTHLNVSNPDKPLLLVAASELNNHRKGFDLLIAALNRIKIQVNVVAVGNKPNNGFDLENFRYTGFIADENDLARWYSLADAVIIPSREDNLPNVMLEALSCGTPAIGFRVGGLRDHIFEDSTGLLADNLDADLLAEKINWFLYHPEKFSQQIIRQYALENFGAEKVVAAHFSVYEKLLQSGQ